MYKKSSTDTLATSNDIIVDADSYVCSICHKHDTHQHNQPELSSNPIIPHKYQPVRSRHLVLPSTQLRVDWSLALASARYQQGTHLLAYTKQQQAYYCPLGVLLELLGAQIPQIQQQRRQCNQDYAPHNLDSPLACDSYKIYTFQQQHKHTSAKLLPDNLALAIGLHCSQNCLQDMLTTLNDDGENFTRLAYFIRYEII